jgi:phosphoribosylformylglycinamidine synthase
LSDFNSLDKIGLKEFSKKYGLALDLADLLFVQEHFKSINRAPTITEIKVVDTYWSDHCRHTTFNTVLDNIVFEDEIIEEEYQNYLAARKELERTKPVSLMDIGTIAAKLLKKRGLLTQLDESDEINACTIKIKVNIDGTYEPWLLLFKNETHNHPTEIEPFGGAATCIGGAIRDPLSGRAYVYAAMRISGAGNPLTKYEDTLKGKLPQRKIVTTAANGYSSYGNQIGLATGLVEEIYHDGYVAKHMEVGAVLGAVPQANVRRETPAKGDKVILIGGRTGRDGCGGATGSSKSHDSTSLTQCGAEVQKGNAPEERKLQRLFRNKDASLLIKRCNDFGAGGVSVAIGELAEGLDIDLNAVPKKYEGLDGTELAISESQERMAVVVEEKNVKTFLELAQKENLEATVVATVTDNNRLKMKWNGKYIVDISREFLDTNGAQKHADAKVAAGRPYQKTVSESFKDNYTKLVGDINVCSKRGLVERFDSTIGSGTVIMPFGGSTQRTPAQAMVNKISVENKHTNTASVMTWGFNPYISQNNAFDAGYLAVVESVSKLIAAGAQFKDVYLTFQEYFEKLNKDPLRWGKPIASLLGAFKAQRELSIAAIGGKDSMSGSFNDLDVPPTLISFAVTTMQAGDAVTNYFKKPSHKTIAVLPSKDSRGLPTAVSLMSVFDFVNKMLNSKKAVAAYTATYGGIAEAVFKMCLGLDLGFVYNAKVAQQTLFEYNYGAFVLELNDDACLEEGGNFTVLNLGTTSAEKIIKYGNSQILTEDLVNIYEGKLREVYPLNSAFNPQKPTTYSFHAVERIKPKNRTERINVLIPVFPGTNCEYDTAKAFADAGANPQIFVVNNLDAKNLSESVRRFAQQLKNSQILFIPGGFSGGDEPDGSGKFITAFLRNSEISDTLMDLLTNRDGLVGGICNGFQALVKLGLVPYGKIAEAKTDSPTLTFNTIGRHQSKIVKIRIASNKSPWLSAVNVGDIFNVPISHGEGRFVATEKEIKEMAANGQIATQYVDNDGLVSADIQYNPNGSVEAIEGITSFDGRVFGKMGHAERIGQNLYKNVEGNYDIKIFESAVKYFKL